MRPSHTPILAAILLTAIACAGEIPVPERSLSAQRGTFVPLDGSDVADALFQYAWRLTERPEDSEAEIILGQDETKAVFFADQLGDYRAELVAAFGVSSAPVLRVSVAVDTVLPLRPSAGGTTGGVDAGAAGHWPQNGGRKLR